MKRLTALILLCALLVSLLCGCGGSKSTIITAQEAQEIALNDAGISAEDAEIHVHAGAYEDTPCFGIYITVGGTTYEYMIAAQTGEILSSGTSSGGHSH